jgi:type IV pilus assembly protein PilA
MNRRAGFTLVELMVVVAIIGILSAVAIPNFQKYQAKSKTSEAKLLLAGIYTAMQAWSADYSTFSSCLDSMGFGAVNSNYYAVGFDANSVVAHAALNVVAMGNGSSVCGTNTTDGTTVNDDGDGTAEAAIGAVDTQNYDAARGQGAVRADGGDLITPNTPNAAVITATTFRAAALGVISGGTGFGTVAAGDAWEMNQLKALSNPRLGY